MDDLQATLQSLLDHPDELGKLAQTAASMLQDNEEDESGGLPDMNQLISMFKSSTQSGTQNLIHALAPFLSDARRSRLERASRVAHLSSLAELALGREEDRG